MDTSELQDLISKGPEEAMLLGANGLVHPLESVVQNVQKVDGKRIVDCHSMQVPAVGPPLVLDDYTPTTVEQMFEDVLDEKALSNSSGAEKMRALTKLMKEVHSYAQLLGKAALRSPEPSQLPYAVVGEMVLSLVHMFCRYGISFNENLDPLGAALLSGALMESSRYFQAAMSIYRDPSTVPDPDILELSWHINRVASQFKDYTLWEKALYTATGEPTEGPERELDNIPRTPRYLILDCLSNLHALLPARRPENWHKELHTFIHHTKYVMDSSSYMSPQKVLVRDSAIRFSSNLYCSSLVGIYRGAPNTYFHDRFPMYGMAKLIRGVNILPRPRGKLTQEDVREGLTLRCLVDSINVRPPTGAVAASPST